MNRTQLAINNLADTVEYTQVARGLDEAFALLGRLQLGLLLGIHDTPSSSWRSWPLGAAINGSSSGFGKKFSFDTIKGGLVRLWVFPRIARYHDVGRGTTGMPVCFSNASRATRAAPATAAAQEKGLRQGGLEQAEENQVVRGRRQMTRDTVFVLNLVSQEPGWSPCWHST